MSEPRLHACSRDFPGTLEAAAEAEHWVAGQASGWELGARAEFAISLCVEELFLNAVRHGHAHRTSISVRAELNAVILEFDDDGEPFDPTAAPAKRINGPTDDFEIGGYGSGLIQRFSRRISYCRSEGVNRLVLEFDTSADALSAP
jgi:anti-sigma regulatory factor (Ser/Thr protein kinase)